ncbi:energy-coupling factor transporter transmembrane protein EcfT [Corynebacterium canis]|uniref:Energy-coupling factor transporter transmembrane protein EcfT n=1 Tax=Corynebacterium canis TaxID=679663 RepID=A0A5C5UH10_9CORY|nr:energy-coupling factor transporter transmembrane component T [Corynebacterium canis]TWT24963.1 energy-coupling factor transporter transmembrane protein EcfT [Corynebacterium canis]WJY74852.1 Putative HMP/thiamine permease protein YkoC [Corynebacterium canis]
MKTPPTLNPVTRILGLLIVTTPLLLSVDIVSAGVSLAWTLLLAPLLGVDLRTVARRSVPILVAAPLSGISMALYGRPEGREYASFLFAHITDNSLSLAMAIMVRVLAVGIPVVVLTAQVDPTDLGDGVAQRLKLPPRFVVGAVAGVRLLSLFRRDWEAMARARRARGIADRGRVRHGMSMAFGLLVLALRRGSALATAMEARGFGSNQRTWARESIMTRIDAVVLAVCFGVAACSIGVSVATGAFRFLGA